MKKGIEYVLIDCGYFKHFAKHSVREPLDLNNFKDVLAERYFNILCELNSVFGHYNFVFCRDDKRERLFRRKLLPGYKMNRDDKFNQLTENEKLLEKKCNDFFNEFINFIGKVLFDNVLFEKTYEADDLQAYFIEQNSGYTSNTFVIVANDSDLFQLLSWRTKMFKLSDHSFFTKEDFKKQYDLETYDWALIKSMTGDTADNIKGIKGIGLKKATQYLKRTLVEKLKSGAFPQAYINIVMDSERILKENFPIVKLPYDSHGFEKTHFKKKHQRKIIWKEVINKLIIMEESEQYIKDMFYFNFYDYIEYFCFHAGIRKAPRKKKDKLKFAKEICL